MKKSHKTKGHSKASRRAKPVITSTARRPFAELRKLLPQQESRHGRND